MKTLFITHCAVATLCSIAQIHKSYANGMDTYEWRSAVYLPGEPNFNINRQESVNAFLCPIPILLYPNPVKGGEYKLVMKDATASYEIIVKDAAGNIVRSYQGFRGERLVISGIKNGIYQVRVKNLSTGKIFTDTLIMKE